MEQVHANATISWKAIRDLVVISAQATGVLIVAPVAAVVVALLVPSVRHEFGELIEMMRNPPLREVRHTFIRNGAAATVDDLLARLESDLGAHGLEFEVISRSDDELSIRVPCDGCVRRNDVGQLVDLWLPGVHSTGWFLARGSSSSGIHPGDELSSLPGVSVIVLGVLLGPAVGFAVAGVWCWRGRPPLSQIFAWPSWGALGTGVVTWAGLVGFALGYMLVVGRLGWIEDSSGSFAVLDAVLGSGWSRAALVALPAIGEEIFFRGYALWRLRSRWGTRWAVVLTSALFTGLHAQIAMTPVVVPIYLALGATLAGLALASRSLVVPILVHAAYNVTVAFV